MFKSILKYEMSTYLSLYENKSYFTYMHIKEMLISLDSFLQNKEVNNKNIPLNFVEEWIELSFSKYSRVNFHNQILSINKFFRYLSTLGIEIDQLYHRAPLDDYTPYIFSDIEIEKILEYFDNHPNVFNHNYLPKFILIETPIILRLLIYCGLRIGETLNIKLCDISFEKNVILLRKTKNKKERLVPIHPHLAEILIKYLNYMQPQNYDLIFPGVDFNTPIPTSTMRRIFSTAKENLNIKSGPKIKYKRGPCLHCLRHYFVLKAFKQGVASGISVESSIPYLSYYLGHNSLNETEKYMKFSSELFPEEMEKFDDYSMEIFPEDI